jgi:hypothetical protein
VQVDLGELLDDEEQAVSLRQLGDLLLELEILEDLPGLRREALDVVRQVLGDLVGVALQLLKVELTGVVELQPRSAVQDRFNVLDAAALECGESAGAILGHTTPRERRGAAEEK